MDSSPPYSIIRKTLLLHKMGAQIRKVVAKIYYEMMKRYGRFFKEGMKPKWKTAVRKIKSY